MASYIEFTKVQKVRVPIKEEMCVNEFIDFMNGDSNIYDYEKELFDFDNEEVVEEEHSYMNNDCKLVCNDKVDFEYKSPYQGLVLMKLQKQ